MPVQERRHPGDRSRRPRRVAQPRRSGRRHESHRAGRWATPPGRASVAGVPHSLLTGGIASGFGLVIATMSCVAPVTRAAPTLPTTRIAHSIVSVRGGPAPRRCGTGQRPGGPTARNTGEARGKSLLTAIHAERAHAITWQTFLPNSEKPSTGVMCIAPETRGSTHAQFLDR